MTQKDLFTKDPSSYHLDTLANHSAQAAKGEASKIQDTSFRTLLKLLHKQDLLMQFSRMFMDTFRLDSTKFSAKWDHLITPQRHLLFQLRVSAHIKEIGSGSFAKMYPTPDASMGKRGTQPNWSRQRPSGHHATYTLNQAVRDLEEQTNKTTAKLSPGFVEYLMGFPTGWTNPDISNEQLIRMNTEQTD